MSKERYPIIGHGEVYVEPIKYVPRPGNSDRPHEYMEAKARIISNIERIKEEIKKNDEIFFKEKFVCIRMEPKYEAKSYSPNSILVSKEDMKLVGGRKYSFNEGNEVKSGKLYFMKTTDTGLAALENTLKEGLKDKVDSFTKEIRSIRSIDLLTPDEKVMGFNDNWESGEVEVILHPIKINNENVIQNFFNLVKVDRKHAKIKTYENGVTFISLKIDSNKINDIKKFNPLRAVHPQGRVSLTPTSNTYTETESVLRDTATKKSIIKVGVFDGGANENHHLLKGYTKNFDCVSTEIHSRSFWHGSAVCGAILHGDLRHQTRGIKEIPVLSVDSFRVLPVDPTSDSEAVIGLYDSIDAIEKVVEERKDIKVFNLSFGPEGAIIDDSINRFTYSLDRLTYDVEEGEENPLFCVAVGNDGKLSEPLNRIQSPADMVNGLAIGAYTIKPGGAIKRAAYSCIGSGREGAKTKPDLLEFGGCDTTPFFLLGNKDNEYERTSGTSFASPLAARKIGQLMASSKNITPHMARTLLIHHANFNKELSTVEQGFGISNTPIEEIINCDDKEVTLLYSGKLRPTQAVKLPIFAPKIDATKGTVQIKWTISTIVDPYVNDPDSYTNNCIEVVFVPHEMKYRFSKSGSKDHKLNLLDPKHAATVKQLMDDGYKISTNPISRSSKTKKSELDLRKYDLKWDTVIRKDVSMNGTSLYNPYLSLHAMSRNDFEQSDMKYFAVITITAKNYNGSLYNEILQQYKNLLPIELRAKNRVMIDISK